MTLLGDAGAAFLGDAGGADICAVNCTQGGTAVCKPGWTCQSFVPLIAASYCVLPCSSADAGSDAGDAGLCPPTTACNPLGFCL